MTIKKIDVKDVIDAHYSVNINSAVKDTDKMCNQSFVGIATMKEKDFVNNITGRTLFKHRHNLIVLRGRTFALEKLFDDPIGSNGGGSYISDLNRKIIGFRVGKAGTPAGDPFAPIAPSPLDLNLGERVPFRLHDTDSIGEGDPRTFIPPEEISNYGDPTIVDPAKTLYYMKHFDNRDPEWVWDDTTNEVYKKIMLSITNNDCRTEVANRIDELSLITARYNGLDIHGASIFVNPEIFSRITFPSEFLSGDKGLEIEYRIYA
jgi:hypothetical protein